MSTLVEAFSIQLKNKDAKSRKEAIEKELESKNVSQLISEIKEDDIFSLKDSRSNIGKYIELLKIIAEFAEDHVNYQLIKKDRPYILVFHIKRFAFDISTMNRPFM